MDCNQIFDIVNKHFSIGTPLQISININAQLLRNKNLTLSQIHRQITNSKQVIGKKTNRDFWHYLTNGGFYLTYEDENSVQLNYFVCTESNINESLIQNMKARIKKIIWSKIEIEFIPIQYLRERIMKDGIQNNITFIGQAHFLKNKIVTTSNPETIKFDFSQPNFIC